MKVSIISAYFALATAAMAIPDGYNNNNNK
jgi:hypothetical protein